MILAAGKALRDVFGETVAELADDDPRSSSSTGTWAAPPGPTSSRTLTPSGFFQWASPNENLLGAAVGMATVASSPSSPPYACFAVARALDSVRVLIAQPKLPVKIVGSYAGSWPA